MAKATTSQHTTGPWKTSVFHDNCEIMPDRPFCTVIGTVYGNSNTSKANARLIAAAPEMFDILKSIRDFVAENEAPDETGEQLVTIRIDEIIYKVEKP